MLDFLESTLSVLEFELLELEWLLIPFPNGLRVDLEEEPEELDEFEVLLSGPVSDSKNQQYEMVKPLWLRM